MPVPTDITQLDTNEANNSPAGTETAKGNIDNYLRAAFAFIKQNYNYLQTTITTANAALPKAGGTMTGALNEAKGTDVASTATINLTSATGNLVDVTGTTTITAITLAEGAERTVRFTGSLTLTNGASLVLPGSTNITTTAGDFAIFRGYASGVVRCVTYTKANGAAVGVAPAPCVRGLKGNVNTATPLTKFDLSADMVVLRDANGGTVTRYNTGTHTVDLNLAGPIAAGRDQAGVFPANSWVHLYWVWNGTVLGVVASLALPTVGPTLPPGCTHWCYATTIRWNASSNILPVTVRGRFAQKDSVERALAAGVATAFTAISLSSYVPPNALTAKVNFLLVMSHSVVGSGFDLTYRPTGSSSTNIGVAALYIQVAGANLAALNTTDIAMNGSQQIDYRISAVPTTGGAHIDVLGYTVPNGDA